MKTSDHRRSYLKWTVLSAVGAVLSPTAAAVLLALSQSALAVVAAAIGVFVGLGAAALAASGAVTLARDKRAELGAPDLFLARNQARSEGSIAARTTPPMVASGAGPRISRPVTTSLSATRSASVA